MISDNGNVTMFVELMMARVSSQPFAMKSRSNFAQVCEALQGSPTASTQAYGMTSKYLDRELLLR